jgi:general stress protein 26
MSDVKQKIQEVFKDRPLAVIATLTEDGKPWCRYVSPRLQDDFTLKFSTFAGSRKVKHIERNPEVHIVCGVATMETAKHYLQIQGKARVSDDPAEKKAYWTDDLKGYFQGPDDPNMRIVVIEPYRIEYQTMSSMQPEVWEA